MVGVNVAKAEKSIRITHVEIKAFVSIKNKGTKSRITMGNQRIEIPKYKI